MKIYVSCIAFSACMATLSLNPRISMLYQIVNSTSELQVLVQIMDMIFIDWPPQFCLHNGMKWLLLCSSGTVIVLPTKTGKS